MRSGNWCFNRALFLQNLERFWPIPVLSALAWVCELPLSLVQAGEEGFDRITVTAAGYCGWIGAVSGLIAAMAVFSYLFSRRAAVAVHALPVRREGLFVTNYLSGLVLMVLPMVINGIVMAVVEGIVGRVHPSTLLLWFTAQLMSNLFFYGLAVFCTALTGNIVLYPVLYGGVQLAAYGVAWLMDRMGGLFLRGFVTFSNLDRLAVWLSPLVRMKREIRACVLRGEGDTHRYYLTGWKTLLVYLLASLVLAAAALLLYRHREVESAGEMAAIPVLRPVFRYAMTVVAALALSGLFVIRLSSIDTVGRLCLYLCSVYMGGLLGYFGAQMVLTKSLDVFRGGWTGYAVSMLLLTGLVIGLKNDAIGVTAWIPDPERVAEVQVRYSGYGQLETGRVTDPAGIEQVAALHSRVVDSPEEEFLSDRYEQALADTETDEHSGESYVEGIPYEEWVAQRDCYTVVLTYTMKSGAEHIRAYRIYADRQRLEENTTAASALQSLVCNECFRTQSEERLETLTSEQVAGAYLTTYFIPDSGNGISDCYVELNAASAWKLVEAIRQDLEAGAAARSRYLLQEELNRNTYVDVGIECAADRAGWSEEMTGEAGYVYPGLTSINVRLAPEFTQTIEVMKELGVESDTYSVQVTPETLWYGDWNWQNTTVYYDKEAGVYRSYG